LLLAYRTLVRARGLLSRRDQSFNIKQLANLFQL